MDRESATIFINIFVASGAMAGLFFAIGHFAPRFMPVSMQGKSPRARWTTIIVIVLIAAAVLALAVAKTKKLSKMEIEPVHIPDLTFTNQPSVPEAESTTPQTTPTEVEQPARAAPTTTPGLVLSEEEEALAWLMLVPDIAPKTVKLTEARTFPILVDKIARGMTTIPAGAQGNVICYDEDTDIVTAQFAGSPQRLPVSSTDFLQQLVEIYRTDKKLDEITIPHLEFTDLNLNEVFALLQEKANEQSSSVDGRGGSIKFQMAVSSSPLVSITLDVTNVSLREALFYVLRLFDLDFRPLQKNMILIVPKSKGVMQGYEKEVPGENGITHIYRR